MRNKLLIATFFSAFLLFSPNVKAAHFVDNQTVDSNKTWTIKFTNEVGFDDSTKDAITITDSNSNVVDVGIEQGQDLKTLIITAPEGGYTPGENYVLNMGSNAHSKDGTQLKNEINFNFSIKNDEAIVTFKDKKLEQAIRDTISKPTGDIYKIDVEEITELDAGKALIQDISGIESLINLQTLNLQGNQITDISPLKDLANLSTLYLNNNKIKDISALKNMTNLSTLYLANNNITDYTPVKGYYEGIYDKDFEMPRIFKDENLQQIVNDTINKPSGEIDKSDVQKVTELSAGSFGIEDISGVENLINLQIFDLSSNQITDISALKGLTKLQQLNLSSNQITNITALKGLINLQKLDLSSNEIKDISALKGLTNLKELDLSSNQVSEADQEALQKSLPNCNIYF